MESDKCPVFLSGFVYQVAHGVQLKIVSTEQIGAVEGQACFARAVPDKRSIKPQDARLGGFERTIHSAVA